MIKICFAGLGSIGQRHIRNLTGILNEKKENYMIDAVRKGKKELPEDIRAKIHTEYDSIRDIPYDYDVFFVTNPTINHYETIREATIHAKHLFIEKPVFDKPLQTWDDLCLRKKHIYYVACPLRYSSCFEYIKTMIENEKIYSVRSISSSYLPRWRKETDYRKSYSADNKRGGGVTLDLIHELDYLTSLFGMPEKTFHVRGKYSDLEITSDDLSVYILQYPDKLVEIHLDYFGRSTVRTMEIFCQQYTICCDFIHNRIYRHNAEKNTEAVDTGEKDMYINEMQAFLEMIEGKRDNINSIQHANEVLKLALL